MNTVDVRGLLSLLLADGSMSQYRSPCGGSIQLIFIVGIKESAFLEDKVAEVRHFLPTKAQITPYQHTTRANGKSTPGLRFRVTSNKLRPVYNLLYPRGDRTITDTLLGMLGARAAAWLWAEGARPNPDGSVLLKRVGLTFQEAALVSHWIQMLCGAESEINEEKLRPRLYFSEKQAAKFRLNFRPYAPASRKHLFWKEQWDVSTIRSARTELLLGQGADGTKGPPEAPTAADHPARNGAGVSAPPAGLPAATP